MAGLLAWAADVVGGAHQTNDLDPIQPIFTDDQKNYLQELDRKASSLSRTIQDLRLRLPPPDISQRLPHLLAHSLASNNALALQLNAHSATKEQAQLREVTLLEENVAYGRAISDCENKILEKKQEADLLHRKLKEMEETQKKLEEELENLETALNSEQSGKSADSVVLTQNTYEVGENTEAEKSTLLEKLENKKRELRSKEDIIQDLEEKWAKVQEKAMKQPTPAQREKMLDRQLHGLIEQLAAKQAQAESLVGDVHMKEKELERLNEIQKQFENSHPEANSTRNRFGRSNSVRGSASLHYITNSNNRTEQQERLMLLRSTFVLYILFLHILVFIKLSF